jgi:plastocyanin
MQCTAIERPPGRAFCARTGRRCVSKMRSIPLAAALLLVAGTAFGSPPPREPSSSPAAVVHMVQGDRFSPEVVYVRRGDTVRFQNESLSTHTVTDIPAAARFPDDARVPEGVEPFDSGPLGLGQSYSHAFEVPGVYRYFCMLHEGKRMIGAVVVEP